MASRGPRHPSFDLLSRYRGVLMGVQILLIMAFHYTEDLSNAAGRFDGPAQLFYDYIGSSGVDMFLMISGLGLYYSWKRNPDARAFYRKRLTRVLVPYAVVALVGWIWLDFIHSHAGAVRFLADITFVTFFTDGVKWFWYIAVCLVCYALFPAVFAVVDNDDRNVAGPWGRTLAMCVAASMVAVMLYRFVPAAYDNVDLIVNRLPCFVFGVLLGRLSYERRPVSMTIVSVYLIAVVIMLYPMQMDDIPLVKSFLRAALNLLLCICGVAVMNAMSRAGKPALTGLHDVLSKVLGWFGRYSLELYLLHVMIRKMLNLNDLPTVRLRYEAVVVIGAIVLAIPLKRLCGLLQHLLCASWIQRNVMPTTIAPRKGPRNGTATLRT
ncbi:acyltransferase family protein [Bifidobacterium leontopitheci]|nr:acyltransferase [Bifidobacterium leontopitheci]